MFQTVFKLLALSTFVLQFLQTIKSFDLRHFSREDAIYRSISIREFEPNISCSRSPRQFVVTVSGITCDLRKENIRGFFKLFRIPKRNAHIEVRREETMRYLHVHKHVHI
jgi:hypothetical protein